MKLALQMRLVTQGATTVAQGETPILDISNPSWPLVVRATTETVNFLRSHCSSVQWLMGSHSCPEEKDFTQLKVRVWELLQKLQRNVYEEFMMVSPVAYPGRTEWIMEFSRRIPNKDK